MSGQTFEYHGYFEALHDVERNKMLGTRKLDAIPAGRSLGNSNAVEVILTERVVLSRGTKDIVIFASKRRPIRCISSINPICGRMIRPIHSQP